MVAAPSDIPMASRSIQHVLLHDSKRLAGLLAFDIGSARIEVQCLLQHVLGVTRAYLLAHPERCLNDAEQVQYDELLQRRLQGEPVAYLLGEREFFGLRFKVTPATLIPRPDTELLVELALQRCERVAAPPPGTHRPPPCGEIPQKHPSPQPSPPCGRGGKFRVLDMGTGSGAIALAIAHSRPEAEILACDASAAALDVARENALHLGIANVLFVQSDWFSALGAQHFDLIVSNPPYISAGDPHLQQGDLRFEPASALASGNDGLNDIRRIVAGAVVHLNSGGWLLLEHGYDQAERVRELLRQTGFGDVFSACDLAGIERVSGGRSAH